MNLPKQDRGIDQIAETHSGKFWTIQAKFRTNIDRALAYKELSTFSTLSFVHCRGISLGLVSHTSTLPIRRRDLLGDIAELGFNHWFNIDADRWEQIQAKARAKPKRLRPRKMRPHQKEAVAATTAHFAKRKNTRGRIVMPCGSGKSLVAFWAAEALKANSVVVAVPSLYLIGQALKDWAREYLAKSVKADWLVICRDKTTAELNKGEFVGGAYELGIETTTDPEKIKGFLSKRKSKKKVIFATYQSGRRLSHPLTPHDRAVGG